ncbi:MAG: hypothetical protein LC115_06640, partial [Bacteroidia bacterium]|nr:hypothetical protein [Bacteroidia bacterium]
MQQENFSNQSSKAIPLPEKIKVQENNYEIEFTWKWSVLIGIFLLIVAAFWIGIIITLILSMHNSGSQVPEYLFLSLHSIVGIGLFYYAIASILNQTKVVADRNEIRITHEPLPWFGAKNINRINIRQLYVVKVVTKTKNGYSTTYSLKGIDQNEKTFSIISNLPDLETGKYLEQKIESFWNIKNYPVQG